MKQRNSGDATMQDLDRAAVSLALGRRRLGYRAAWRAQCELAEADQRIVQAGAAKRLTVPDKDEDGAPMPDAT